MKKLVVLLLASLVATSAFAVIDPDPDMLGIYFDTNADINGTITPAAGIPFDLYLIATNPTPAVINAYEMNLVVEYPAGYTIFMLASDIANNVISGIDVGSNDKDGGDYAVGLNDPGLTTSPATILHHWTYFQSGAMFPMNFYLRANSLPSIEGDLPVLQDADGSRLYQVGTSTGGPDIPVAIVNPVELDPETGEWPADPADWVFLTDPTGPVAVESASFGSVKSLFR